MRVLMLSWEYPPHSVGGLAQHVHDLAKAMEKQGIDVHVLTQGHGGEERSGNLWVHRVQPYDLWGMDFVSGILHLNLRFAEEAMGIMGRFPDIRLVHAHDWLTAYAGRTIKHGFRIPMIATIHATEFGRNNGLHNPLQRYISQVEWWLTYESWQVICCSNYMAGELRWVFQLPEDKIRIIPNGVVAEAFRKSTGLFRREDFARPDEPIVFYVGRIVQEKGIHVLLAAAHKVLEQFPKTKFIIAGSGPQEGTLKHQAHILGLSDRVHFVGRVDDETRNGLYRSAAAAVFPSLYEPFGIVALEAMAAGAPLVVSDTGGLSEIVEHGRNGLKAYPGNAQSIADQILRLLHNPLEAQRMKKEAARDVSERYHWDAIAKKTLGVYEDVLKSAQKSGWLLKGPKTIGERVKGGSLS